MNYHKLIAMKLSVLCKKDQRWLLRELDPHNSEKIKILIKEFSTLNKNKKAGVVNYFSSWLDKDHLKNEKKLDELDHLSHEISKYSDEVMAPIISKIPTGLRSLLFASESWQCLAYKKDQKFIENDNNCKFLSKKMRDSMLRIIHSDIIQFER